MVIILFISLEGESFGLGQSDMLGWSGKSLEAAARRADLALINYQAIALAVSWVIGVDGLTFVRRAPIHLGGCIHVLKFVIIVYLKF